MKKNIDMNIDESQLTFQSPNHTHATDKRQKTLDFFSTEEPKKVVEEKVEQPATKKKTTKTATKQVSDKGTKTKATKTKQTDASGENKKTTTTKKPKTTTKTKKVVKEVPQKTEAKAIDNSVTIEKVKEAFRVATKIKEMSKAEETKMEEVKVEENGNQNAVEVEENGVNTNAIDVTENKLESNKEEENIMENEKVEQVEEKVEVETKAEEAKEEEELDIYSLDVVEDTLENKKESFKESVEKMENENEVAQETNAEENAEAEQPKEKLLQKIIRKFKKFIKNVSVKISICKIVTKNAVIKEAHDKKALHKLQKGLSVVKGKTQKTLGAAKGKTQGALHTADIALNNTVSNMRRVRFENQVKAMLNEQNKGKDDIEVTPKSAKFDDELQNASEVLKAGITKNDFNILRAEEGEDFFPETLDNKDQKKVKKALEKAVDRLSETRLEVETQKKYVEDKLWDDIEKINHEKTQLYRDGIRAINDYKKVALDITKQKAAEMVDDLENAKDEIREALKENYNSLLQTLSDFETKIVEKNTEIDALSQKYLGDSSVLNQNETLLVYKKSKLKREIENYRQYFVDQKLVDNLISQIDRMNIKSSKVEYEEALDKLNEKEQKMRYGIVRELEKLQKTFMLDNELENHTIFNVNKTEDLDK